MTRRVPGHCKLCELEDFEDPELRDLIREIFEPDRKQFGERNFPKGREYRKYWEVAMTGRAFKHHGVLNEDSLVLGVGAGYEATIYWLTRKVGRVIATDLYAADDAWSDTDSSVEMLTNPGKFWTGSWNPDRLVVRDMNALELDFPDDHFDAVFSSSSIEHFGSFADIRRSIEEIYRVLKPGGVAALATEFRVEGETEGWPSTYLFDEGALRAAIFDGLWWDPMTPLDTVVSNATRAAPVDLAGAVAERQQHKIGIQDWSQYPHILLSHEDHLFTSVHVAMVKSGAPTAVWRERAPELPPPPPPEPTLRDKLADLGKRARHRLMLDRTS